MFATKPMLVGAAALVALTACEPGTYDASDPHRNRNQSAIAGGIIGAIGGATLGKGDNLGQAAVGAAAGAAIGAAIGNNLDRQAAELQSGFSNNQIGVVNTGNELIVTMPNALLFPFDSAEVSPALRSDLNVLAASLNKYPNSTVVVTGHTDNTGDAGYNQTLSERRALAVTSILRSSGVSGNRLQAVGAGESQPIVSNQTESGRAQNRRVEITIRPY